MTDMMNGVDREALFATIDAVTADKTLAAFEFRLKNEWLEGGLNRSTITDFYGTGQDIPHKTPFVLLNDEPEVLLSGDKGPNPVENLLHALAGCMTSSIAYHAAARGIAIGSIRTRFEGDIDLYGFLGLSDEVRRGFSEIRVVFEFGGDLTMEQKRELVVIAETYSPVFDMVANGTTVTSRLAEDVRMEAAE